MPEIRHVGWGGVPKVVYADKRLGYGTNRGVPQYGIRRAVWDAAFGYVSGFAVRDILYYLLTRSINRRLSVWAMKREGVEFRNGIAVGRVVTVETSSNIPTDRSGS